MNHLFCAILLVVQSFTAHFVQQKHTQLLAEPQQSEGQLTYRAPDYLRWEYTAPTPLVWELDGDKGNMNRQVKNLVQLIRQCVTGNFAAAENDFTWQREGQELILTPKKRELARLFTQVVVTLNPATEVADQVKIVDSNGDITLIQFSDVLFF